MGLLTILPRGRHQCSKYSCGSFRSDYTNRWRPSEVVLIGSDKVGWQIARGKSEFHIVGRCGIILRQVKSCKYRRIKECRYCRKQSVYLMSRWKCLYHSIRLLRDRNADTHGPVTSRSQIQPCHKQQPYFPSHCDSSFHHTTRFFVQPCIPALVMPS